MSDNGSVGPTPGPWRVDGKGCSISIVAGDYFIANAIQNNGNPKNDANARLIAAAPELAESGRKLNALVEKMQAAVTEFLTPDSNTTNGDLIHKLIGLLDGPKQREAQGELRAALQKAGLSAGEGC